MSVHIGARPQPKWGTIAANETIGEGAPKPGKARDDMLVTTKGRYAMRLMVYIASFPERKVALREVAENEDISLKYLEQLAHDMVEADLLSSVRGHGGGYLLARPAETIRAGDILRAAEGTTVPVACAALEDGGVGCPRESTCSTIAFWTGLDDVIEAYVDGVTLADLAV